MELELNGFAAIYRTDGARRELGSSRAAMAWSEDGRTLRLLIEGEPGKPTAWQMRMERPLRIAQARVTAPECFAGVGIQHRDTAQPPEVRLPPLPGAERGVSAEEACALFPRLRPDPARSRVSIEIDLKKVKKRCCVPRAVPVGCACFSAVEAGKRDAGAVENRCKNKLQKRG